MDKCKQAWLSGEEVCKLWALSVCLTLKAVPYGWPNLISEFRLDQHSWPERAMKRGTMQDWVQAGWMDPSWVSEWVSLKVMRVQHALPPVQPRLHGLHFLSIFIVLQHFKKMQVNSLEQMHVCVIGSCNCQSPPCDNVSDVDAKSRKNFCFFKIKRSLMLGRNFGFVWAAHSPWVGQNSNYLLLFMSMVIRILPTPRCAIAPQVLAGLVIFTSTKLSQVHHKRRLTFDVLVDDALQPVQPFHNPQGLPFAVLLQLSVRLSAAALGHFGTPVGHIVGDPADVQEANDVCHPAQDHACRHQSFSFPCAQHRDNPPWASCCRCAQPGGVMRRRRTKLQQRDADEPSPPLGTGTPFLRAFKRFKSSSLE